VKLLTFSSLYPSSARPQHGLFVAARLHELRKRQGWQAQVLAPVPWFPWRHPRFGQYAAWASTPLQEPWQGQAVAHPRYAMVPKIGMRWQPDAMAAAAVRWIDAWRDQGHDFDLIDAHYFYPDGVAAAQLARRYGKPLVITARGSDLNLIGQDSRARRRMLAACEQAGACVGVSQALVDVLRSWGVPEAKLHVVRNGVDLDRFKLQPRAQARQRLGLDAQAPLLLCVGNLLELKGQHLLLDMTHRLLERFPSLQLVLAGEGPERAALEAQRDRLGLQDRVRLLGSVPQTELPDWLAAADLKLLPSSREGLPNAVLEALACGTPVVATAVGGVPEVISAKGVGTLLDERSVDALVRAVPPWLETPADPHWVRQHALGFAWDTSVQRLSSLMTDVVQAGGKRHA
jgi:teichuronic acid biosynthesis glycosyltransferase TuaC